LTSLQLQLVKNGLTKPQFQNPDFFVNSLKNFRLQISGLRDIHEAISSVGGFPVAQIDSNWQVKGWSSKYVIGEMVDWDAPTGGFLLQGCFASALKVVRHILS
jgi:predicted flavoprotein YhiN